MKESITKFDLEAAFKALDEIEAPKADKIKANRPALTEIFSRKSKFDALMEEYYDISNMAELDDAKEAREAEVAQAKLARIEKIVDLDAESPEDLLPSYVGKFIMQCPQCMTLFYKDPEDVEASEEDPSTVNVNEVCQHCGNEAGYTLIGKVGEATEEEAADFNQEETIDITSTEEGEEELEAADDVAEEPSEDDLDIELDELDLNIEDDAEEKAEESFNVGGGETLVEELTEDKDLDISADEFEELISSPEFKQPISDTEARSMINELDGEKEEEVKENFVTEAVLDPDSALADIIYDIFNSGKFIYLPTRNTPPKSKKINDSTYQVTSRRTGSEVLVNFDLDNSNSKIIIFTINDNKYSAKTISEAQDIILDELQKAYRKSFDVALDESIVVNGENIKYAVINPDGTYAGVPCVSEEEARELAAQKEGRVIVELGALKEGIFDNKEKKQKAYAEAIKQVFGKDTGIIANETVTSAIDLIQEVADKFNDDGDNSKTLALGIVKLINSAKVTINKTPHSLVKSIISIGQKYERDSLNLKELVEFNSKVGKLQNSNKDGYKAMEFLFSKINPTLINKLDLTINVLKREFGIVESCDSHTDENEPLEEGIFDKIKDKFTDTVDKIASKLKSREAKADWLLANAMKDYNDIEVNTEGQLVPDKNNQRFKTFVVIGYTSRDSKGNLIKVAPDFDDKNLVIGQNGVQYKTNYEAADKIARGWSMVQGNGPAFIYLAGDKDDNNALFLCEYFMGSLKNDQLEKYFKIVKDHLKGAKLMADGGLNKDEETADNINPEATDNEEEYRGKYLKDNLSTVMENVEELQEATLEKLISDSLVESYGNVAGFRLTECVYEDNKFTVNGTIFFTSGNKRKTTYKFIEALTTNDGKVNIRGLNEKLGLDRQFTIVGHTDSNKTLITESFNTTKK